VNTILLSLIVPQLAKRCSETEKKSNKINETNEKTKTFLVQQKTHVTFKLEQSIESDPEFVLGKLGDFRIYIAAVKRSFNRFNRQKTLKTRAWTCSTVGFFNLFRIINRYQFGRKS